MFLKDRNPEENKPLQLIQSSDLVDSFFLLELPVVVANECRGESMCLLPAQECQDAGTKKGGQITDCPPLALWKVHCFTGLPTLEHFSI